MKEEQNPYRAHLFRRKKTNQNKHTLLFISHYKLARYESSCGHKIQELTPKQIGNEHKQGRKQTEGSGRESSLQRTSPPVRDSGEKTKKQQGQPHIIRVEAEKATI